MILTGIQKVEFAIGTKWIDIITHDVMFVIGQSPESIRVAIVEPAFVNMLSSKNNPLVVVDEIKRFGYGLHLSYLAHELDRLAPPAMTPAQLDRIKELLKDCPQCRLVSGVEGLVTCDGMAIEYPGGVMHPLSFLSMIDDPDEPLIDVLKR